jgi:glutaminyl-tRNA synthetase
MWVLENCNLENQLPEETEFARLNIDYTVISKRKLKRLVEEGFVDGWDDPRMSTISGLRRRGFTPESIKDFCDRISVTRKDGVVSYSLLEECLRTDLNKRSIRLMGVMNPIKLVVTNLPNEGFCEIDNNPEDENSGKRKVAYCNEFWIENEDFREEADKKYHRLKLGGEVRLKGLFIIKANEIIKDESGEIVEIRATYDDTPDKKVKGTIHWVSVKHGINMKVNEYERLFINATPDKSDEDFTTFINLDSLSINDRAIFEPNAIDCKIGEPVQMMRKGYYVLDIDGKSFNKTVSLKEGWNG